MDAAEGKITQLEESLAQTTGQLTQAGLLFYEIIKRLDPKNRPNM